MQGYYQLPEKEVLRVLSTSESGLSNSQVEGRLEKYGLNELARKAKGNVARIVLGQINSIVVYILVAAAIISLVAGQFLDFIVITAILVLNTILGFFQEYKAEKAIEALKKLSAPTCNVIRNNKALALSANQLVPGDIVLLEAGNKVPADCYLLEAFNLKIDESALTGESIPVNKSTLVLNRILPVSEQKNMAFASTIIVYGRGKAVVTSTGMNTEIGKIADLVQHDKEHLTPLQEKLEKFGDVLGIATITICLMILAEGVIEGQPLFDMFLVAISLAVAAIPEGLPAIVTICLAVGVKSMVKKNVLIRRLSSVEALGSTTIICCDKTGTLTCNQMTVKKIFANNSFIEVTGSGYGKEGSFFINKKPFNPSQIKKLIETGYLCNDARVNADLSIIGDPTEAALIVLGDKASITPAYKRLDEVPFNSEAKCMSTTNDISGKKVLHLKGAPEIILSKCSHYLDKNVIRLLTNEMRKKILSANESMAKEALRVLGMAYSNDPSHSKLVFLGLVGMIDPPRPDVNESLVLCRKAGIKVVMVTGDHKITAQSIATQLGLGTRCMTGEEIDSMHPDDFMRSARETDVFARVSPEHKVKILEALMPGNVVAMTGDGINDAPALKKASIGIAVGSSTDVAKEAADMVLTDDHFNSIVNAVEEGRGIYDNIKKFVNYMLSSNFGEVLILFIALLIGFKDLSGKTVLPLLALQLLWINLVTDGLPALALGMDPIYHDVMEKPPRNPKESIISRNMGLTIISIGILMASGVLFLFNKFIANVMLAQTVAFTAVVVLEMVRVQMVRAKYNQGMLSNKWLVFAIASSIALQLAVVYIPSLSKVFRTVPLGMFEWTWIIIVSCVVYLIGHIISSIISKVTKEFD